MGKEQPSAYYNQIFANATAYNAVYKDSHFVNLYNNVYACISKLGLKSEDIKLLDIGCGTGQFLHYLYENGVSNVSGFDFSGIAIEKAKSFIPTRADHIFVCDAFQAQEAVFSDKNIYTSLEFLEHIEDDLGVLSKLPKGRFFVGSVPQFWDVAHVRVFENRKSVELRYHSIIDIEDIIEIGSEGFKVFVFYGEII